ncbi:MAG: response regulator [Candidatus Eisenbacteria bacterium]|uniref:Response regulator n=1 Tax=Eiseniibacteriota bacterium TaxID=2212470 RepID=A0A538U1C6_UNCEI|nr:MAG: response regulator [Candidatus Eisenbacteria bacterium]
MKHVMVVEDDPVNAALFRMLLERRGGCRVTVTESPEEILRVAHEGIDAIVMDISLKGSTYQGRPVSGVDMCRLLKASPATAKIPVVLATAHAMRGDDERLKAQSGANDYVSKPVVDHQAFVAQIRHWLDREEAA